MFEDIKVLIVSCVFLLWYGTWHLFLLIFCQICFQLMMAEEIKMNGETGIQGEIELERIPTRLIEVRSKDLVPVVDYLQHARCANFFFFNLYFPFEFEFCLNVKDILQDKRQNLGDMLIKIKK